MTLETPNKIELPRGNTCEIVITPYADDEQTQVYTLVEGDKIIFTVKSSQFSKRTYIQKILTSADYNSDNKLILSLLPSDTVNLEPFNYCYDCALQKADATRFYTFVTLSPFIITPALGEVIINEETEEPEVETGEEVIENVN